jgi:lipoprotein-anchoring transpeptidase ErfK/SrfK
MRLYRSARIAYFRFQIRAVEAVRHTKRDKGRAMNRWIVVLPVLAAGFASVSASETALGQTVWSGSTPIFESDRRRQADQAEAAREARRKAYRPVVYPKFMQGGERPDIKPVAPPIVHFGRDEDPGSIIIDTEARRLYFVLPGKKAYEYPISVGRDGFTWTGTERISRIASWPSWTPPPEMHKRVPGLPITVTGGMRNPQGARALYLGSTIYRIHGTNNDRTVGRANSSGCFRLTNEHVVHLASIAKVGTKVRVLKSYGGSVGASAPTASLFSFWGNDEPESTAKPEAKPERKAKRPPAKKAKPGTVTAAARATTPSDGSTELVNEAPAPVRSAAVAADVAGGTLSAREDRAERPAPSRKAATATPAARAEAPAVSTAPAAAPAAAVVGRTASIGEPLE